MAHVMNNWQPFDPGPLLAYKCNDLFNKCTMTSHELFYSASKSAAMLCLKYRVVTICSQCVMLSLITRHIGYTASKCQVCMVCANATHHGKYAWACVFACEAFICKSGAIYAETPSAVTLHIDLLLLQHCKRDAAHCRPHFDKIASLNHKAFDDSMEAAAFVANWLHVAPAKACL